METKSRTLHLIPMDLIEHVITWKGLSDEKWHTMVVFTIKSGLPTVCSCQGVTGNDRGGY